MRWTEPQNETLFQLVEKFSAILAADPGARVFPAIVDEFRSITGAPHNVGGITSRIYLFNRETRNPDGTVKSPRRIELSDAFRKAMSAYVAETTVRGDTGPSPEPITVGAPTVAPLAPRIVAVSPETKTPWWEETDGHPAVAPAFDTVLPPVHPMLDPRNAISPPGMTEGVIPEEFLAPPLRNVEIVSESDRAIVRLVRLYLAAKREGLESSPNIFVSRLAEIAG